MITDVQTNLCFTQPTKLTNNVCTVTTDHQYTTPIHILNNALTQPYSHIQHTKQLNQLMQITDNDVDHHLIQGEKPKYRRRGEREDQDLRWVWL